MVEYQKGNISKEIPSSRYELMPRMMSSKTDPAVAKSNPYIIKNITSRVCITVLENKWELCFYAYFHLAWKGWWVEIFGELLCLTCKLFKTLYNFGVLFYPWQNSLFVYVCYNFARFDFSKYLYLSMKIACRDKLNQVALDIITCTVLTRSEC